MPARRIVSAGPTTTLTVDGERIKARVGESIAHALVAHGRWVFSRSVKYHRPRGPACFSGSCEGCLMRVDGVPSVVACRRRVVGGERVTTQNVLGSAEVDLLAAADWFFPHGLNHHELLTWNKTLNAWMQTIARRIAGVGHVPDAAGERAPGPGVMGPVAPEPVDVLVVGAGASGLAAAKALAGFGPVQIIDEAARPGGNRFLSRPATGRLADEAVAAGAALQLETAAVAVFDPHEGPAGAARAALERKPGRRHILGIGPGGLRWWQPAHLVLAVGRLAGPALFPGNDVPGVLSVDAAFHLLEGDIAPGERVALAGEDARFAALSEELRGAGSEAIGPYPLDGLVDVRGKTSVTGLVVADERGRRTVDCDALVVGTASSARYELAAQAGVDVMYRSGRWELTADPHDGRTARPDVRVIGSASGVLDLEAAVQQANAAAAGITEAQVAISTADARR